MPGCAGAARALGTGYKTQALGWRVTALDSSLSGDRPETGRLQGPPEGAWAGAHTALAQPAWHERPTNLATRGKSAEVCVPAGAHTTCTIPVNKSDCFHQTLHLFRLGLIYQKYLLSDQQWQQHLTYPPMSLVCPSELPGRRKQQGPSGRRSSWPPDLPAQLLPGLLHTLLPSPVDWFLTVRRGRRDTTGKHTKTE